MEKTILTLEDRLQHIVDQSYDILCQQITQGRFTINNEASLQLQFSVILKAIGQLYEFAPTDRFYIELEKNIELNTETCKSSNKKARCDIWIKLTSNYNRCAECAIELKCFRKSEGETITDNRFSILKDLENLEHYQSQNKKLICYEVVYTNNPNYTNKNSHSYLAIGNECECTGSITSNSKTVELQNNYTFSWDAFGNKKDGHYFLKTKVKK